MPWENSPLPPVSYWSAYDLCWPVDHLHLKRMCTLQLLDIVSYKCQVSYSVNSNIQCTCLLTDFFIVACEITENVVLKSKNGYVYTRYYWFYVYIIYFEFPLLNRFLCFFDSLIFIPWWSVTLSLVILLAWSIFCLISIQSLQFAYVYFCMVQYIFPLFHIQTICAFVLKWDL